MKLKNKLFLNFGTLFFVTINIFGVILIEFNFKLTLKNTVNSSLGEYSVIYTNLESAKNVGNIFLTNKDIIQVKCETYLNNISNPNISLEFRTLDRELFYSNKQMLDSYPDSIYNLKDNLSNYMIYKNGKEKLIVINNIITINSNKYYFTYVNNLDYLYKNRENSLFILLNLNIIVGLFLLLIIYLISVQITKPINSLIGNIDEIINGNYNKKFEYKSNIQEINEISNNFSFMNEEIQNKIGELKHQNNSKQRFIDNLTHEIRTPLTSIIGYSDLMIKKNVKDVDLMQKSFESINREGRRMLSLTTTLVRLITLDEKTLNMEDLDIIDIINDVNNKLKIKLDQNDVKLSIEGNGFKVFSDRELLSIVIANFVDNGIKATIGRDKRQIYLLLNKDTIKIIDTGKGISEEDIKKIFEPFYIADKSRSKSIDGFGLGLSICKEISELLDINFSVTSKVDVGTEIILRFKGDSIE